MASITTVLILALQDGFVPVTSPVNPDDVMPAPLLVGVAYGFVWVALLGYLWSIRRRLSSVEREMDTLNRRVSTARK